jgi:enoyl-CoA hydratase/carnithine racemase
MIQIEDHGAVRLLVLDRPDALNAFNFELYAALAEGLDAARADDEVRVVVITGNGRAFSAGQDLKEMARLADGIGGDGPSDETETQAGFPLLLDALARFDKPLLAAVNGVAIGIGFTLLPHCDIALAGQSARFRVPFAPLGVPPEAASSYLFPLRMGWQRAAEVLFTGGWLSADEAVERGMALRVVPDAELRPEVLALGSSIAEAPLPALRAIKTAMVEAHRDAIAQARAREEAAFTELLAGFNRELLP